MSSGLLSMSLDDSRRLRLYEEDDVAELHALIDANRGHLADWMPWAAGQTPEDTLAFIRDSASALASHRAFELAIVEHESIVGAAGVNRLDWENRSANVGYWIAEEAQGRGTATLAARALVAHVFDVWRLNRVEIRCGAGNMRSRALAERLGFAEEGLLREAQRIGERFVDQAVYGLLAREWRAEF